MENITYCKIDSNLRKITLPENEKILGVYHDKNVTRKHFKMPRYYQDNDMSEFSIKVNYVNEDKETDCYAVADMLSTEDYITFSWLVGATACRVPGMVGFVICFTKVDEESNIIQEYNTELAVGKVLDGCELGEVTNDKTEKDIIAQFRLSLQQLKDEQDKAVKEIGTSIDNLNRKFEDKCTEVDGLLDTKASTKDVIVNLLPKKAASTFTKDGITIKNDDEGVYTVSGTAEQNVSFAITGSWITPKKFKTKLLGAPAGSSIDTYYIDSLDGNAYTEGLIFEPNKTIGFPHIVIKKGVTLNNVKFKPMLTACLEATCDDYVPNVVSQYIATTLSKVFSEFVKATQKAEDDLKKSVSDGKTLLAEAITEKGIETASGDSFATMAENVKKIQTAGYGVSGYIDTTIETSGGIFAIYGLYTVEEQEAS